MEKTDGLAGAYLRLDAIQKKYLAVLESRIAAEPVPFLRIQMKDMARVIELDVRARETLPPTGREFSRVGLTEDVYTAFLRDVTEILGHVGECGLPDEVRGAYVAIGQALHRQDRLNLRDVSFCVSVTTTAVSLCLARLEPAGQQSVVAALDRMLAVKESCLNHLERMARETNGPKR
jgi:hypothetical protein